MQPARCPNGEPVSLPQAKGSEKFSLSTPNGDCFANSSSRSQVWPAELTSSRSFDELFIISATAMWGILTDDWSTNTVGSCRNGQTCIVLHPLYSESSGELTASAMAAFVCLAISCFSQNLLFFANFQNSKGIGCVRTNSHLNVINLSSGWQSISIQVAGISN